LAVDRAALLGQLEELVQRRQSLGGVPGEEQVALGTEPAHFTLYVTHSDRGRPPVVRVTAINPEIDLGDADRFHGLAEEPTGVTSEEVTAVGLPAISANPLGCDSERVLVYFHGGGFVSGSKGSYRKSPRIWPGPPASGP
jgi:acetyl esterase/lipase